MTPDQAKLLAEFYGAEGIVKRNDERWACWPKHLVEAHRALVKLSETSRLTQAEIHKMSTNPSERETR